MNRQRVPVVLQMNSVECGPACLAMILGYFRRKTRLEECRAKCDPGRDGVSARTIVAAARDFGLRTKAMSMQAGNLAGVSVPCILHWNHDHFVVLERWSRDRVWIVDPGWGRRQLSASDFASGFSGIVLQFEPGPAFDTHTEPGPNLLLNYFQSFLQLPGMGRVLVQLLAASILLQAFAFALPLFTRLLVDRILPQRATGELNILCAAAAVVSLMSASIAYFRAMLLIRLERRLDSHLMLGFFRHLLSLPFRFFQQRSCGDLLMRLGSNATIREALASQTTSAVLDGALVLIFLVALLRVSPLFAFAAFSIALIQAAILLTTARQLQCFVNGDLSSQSASQSCLIESLMGISTLKAAGAERSALARWSELLAKQLDASAKRSVYTAKIDTAMTALKTFSPLFLLWLSGTLVWKDAMSLGTMLAINALAAAFLQPVGSLVLSAQRLQLVSAHLERLVDVLEAEPEQDPRKVHAAPRLSGRIELRNVSFRYDSHSHQVLDNVSLSICPGQKIALVGRTGSGKSTLAKLLLGLYTPTGGEILYDDVPLHKINYQDLRGHCGTVLQDSFLFNSSLRDNISFRREMSEEDVVTAARIAEIHSDVLRMPMRYDTRIDEGGGSLSGGQRQRLAIARAVAHRPPLLLLDEATSHLDVITESLVDRNLDVLSCTRVVVAHRLSTIQNADCIVVLDAGRIVETGTHRDLLAHGGHYAALVAQQCEAPQAALPRMREPRSAFA